MSIKNLQELQIGVSSIEPSIILILTDDTQDTVLTHGYLTNYSRFFGYRFEETQAALVFTTDAHANLYSIDIAINGDVTLINPNSGGGGGGGLTFVSLNSATHSLAINTANYTTYAGLSIMTLPVSAVAGSVIRVIAGPSGNTFRIAQNNGQQIYDGSQIGSSLQTTLGTAGYLQSTDPNTVMELVCVVTDTTWLVSICQQNLIGV